MSKPAILLLMAVLLLCGLEMIGSSFAQSITKPSSPEFSLKPVVYAYNVSPITFVHPSFGRITINQTSYRLEDCSINVVIKNQPFISFFANDSPVMLYFQVQIKGHNSDFWQFYPFLIITESPIPSENYFPQTDAEYTIISVPAFYPLGAQAPTLDFRVRALMGYSNMTNHGLYGFPEWFEFYGETGDWSSAQTITISPSSFRPEPTSTPTICPEPSNAGPTYTPHHPPFYPDIVYWAILLSVIVVVGIVLWLYFRKHMEERNP